MMAQRRAGRLPCGADDARDSASITASDNSIPCHGRHGPPRSWKRARHVARSNGRAATDEKDATMTNTMTKGAASASTLSIDISRGNFIGGKWVKPASDRTDKVIEPATGKTIAEVPSSDKADVDKAVKAALKAFETWGSSSPATRGAALNKFADAIEGEFHFILQPHDADVRLHHVLQIFHHLVRSFAALPIERLEGPARGGFDHRSYPGSGTGI